MHTLVAHRGLSTHYPENTLLALEKAIAADARAVEFDLQFTADKVPVLFHDTTLNRMCACDGEIFELTFTDLEKFSAHFPDRFGDMFVGTPIASFESAVAFLERHPRVLACVEIKVDSVERFGLPECVDRVLALAQPLMNRAQFLSFSPDVIAYLHQCGIRNTNWVIEDVNAESLALAKALGPSALACAIPDRPRPLWPGPWDWMLFQTSDPNEAKNLFDEGARYVESDDIAFLSTTMEL